MTTHTPLRLGTSNDVPSMTLSATPVPDTGTSLDWLKTEWRARRATWDGLIEDDSIVIEGELAESRIAEYFAAPSISIPGNFTVKLEVFNDEAMLTDLLLQAAETVATVIPLGEWRAGIDPYGELDDSTIPDTLVYWFPTYIAYTSFRLTIVAGEGGGDVSLRMLLSGEKLEFQKNFSFGGSIRFLTAPELVQTSSGSYIQVRAPKKARAMDLTLDQMTDTDRLRLSKMETRSLGGPFIASAYPAAHGWQFSQYSYLARFENRLNYAHKFHGLHEVSNLTLLET